MKIPLHRSRQAFTLIELLVVISIVSLLVAILLPALQKARQATRLTMSLSNLRQLTIGLHSYSNDFKSSLPWGRDYQGAGETNKYWPGFLYYSSYVTSKEVFKSPARADLSQEGWLSEQWQQYSGYGAHWSAMPRRLYTVNGWVFTASEVYFLTPIRLGNHAIYKEANFALLAEAWDATPSATLNRGLSGLNSIAADVKNSGKYNRLYTYNHAIPTAYLDAHATATPELDLGWLSTDAYNGDWTYTANGQHRASSPWYSHWFRY